MANKKRETNFRVLAQFIFLNLLSLLSRNTYENEIPCLRK